MIGLFLGTTDFPKKILKRLKQKNIKYFIIDLTKNKIFKSDKNSYSINIGKFGKILNLIKIKKCKKVLFAGKIDKPQFSKLRLDIKGIYYIPRIIKASKLGDAAILKQVINILKNEKIQTVRSDKFTPELNLPKGNYTKIKPDRNDHKDIKIAVNALMKAGYFSHVQGAISRNNKLINTEGLTGTKKMIKKLSGTPPRHSGKSVSK